MKGVTILKDEKTSKRILQIEMEVLEKHQEEIEDLIDGLIAESRKGEPTISLSMVKKELKKRGVL